MIREVQSVAVECDHRDGQTGSPCTAVLMLRATDPGEIDRPTVRVAAAARGWSVVNGEHCPTHRTPTADTATEGAPRA